MDKLLEFSPKNGDVIRVETQGVQSSLTSERVTEMNRRRLSVAEEEMAEVQESSSKPRMTVQTDV